MDKITHQIINSVDGYFNDLPFKGDNFQRANDILYAIISIDVFSYLVYMEYSIQAEALRKKIEEYIAYHPWLSLYSHIFNTEYKNVNSLTSPTVWRRIYDEIGYDNITFNELP